MQSKLTDTELIAGAIRSYRNRAQRGRIVFRAPCLSQCEVVGERIFIRNSYDTLAEYRRHPKTGKFLIVEAP